MNKMIKIIHSFENIDQRKLMDLYRESNEENIAFFYPQMQDKRETLAKVERDYLSYIKNAFFLPKAMRMSFMNLKIFGFLHYGYIGFRRDSITLKHWRHTRNIEERAMMRVCL